MTFLERLAVDIQASNAHLSTKQIKSILARCVIWQYEWGIIAADGDYMHIHILSDYRKKVFLRGALREVTSEMFKAYPVLKTAIMKTKPKALEFDLKMGWKIVGKDNEKWMLELTKESFRYV